MLPTDQARNGTGTGTGRATRDSGKSATLRGFTCSMRWYFAGMRSTWPYLAAVVVAGIGVGTWIAGVPRSEAGIVIATGGGDPVDPDAQGTQNTVALLPTSSFPPITVTPTTEPVRNPVPPAGADTTAPATIPTATDVPPVTTVPPTTQAPATTEVPPTTAVTTSVPVDADLLDRSQVRLVLANGDGRYNLVGRNVDRLVPLGYTTIDQTDAPRPFDRTVLFVRPGFEDEAARLAADLLVPGALIEPLPAEPVTINDDLGDIIVVLGPDAVR